MACIKTAISLDEKLFKDVRRLAQKAKISRSQFIASAIRAYMSQHDKEEMIRRINKAHEKPDPSDQEFMKAAQRHFGKLVEKEPW